MMLNTSKSGSSPDIAIVGSGIAGFVFAIACENAGLQYTMYESGPEIWQHGSGIGLAGNALQGLGLIDEKLPAAVERISSQDLQHTASIHYRFAKDGPGRKAFDTFHHVETEGAKSIARSALMNELSPNIPEHKIKFAKHLTKVTNLADGKEELTFSDGTTAVHDLVVGCDGIHSKIRTHILGKEDPDTKPRFSGKVIHRATVKTSDVLEIFREDEIAGVYSFVGHHSHLVMLPIDGGSRISINAAASRRTWDHDKWVLHTTAEDLQNDFQGWDERLMKVLEKSDKTDMWALFDLPYPRTFVKGNVAILGDAAHASTPFQGSGTAMAIEDSYFLANLLAHTAHQGQRGIQAALQAYDAVRRPRSQKQIHTALEAGWLMELEHPLFYDDIDAIKRALSTRVHWLWRIDLKQELEKTISSMASSLAT